MKEFSAFPADQKSRRTISSRLRTVSLAFLWSFTLPSLGLLLPGNSSFTDLGRVNNLSEHYSQATKKAARKARTASETLFHAALAAAAAHHTQQAQKLVGKTRFVIVPDQHP